jgi:O-antigen/teichoic acid export membrane protein
LLRYGLVGAVVALPLGGLVALLFGLVAVGRRIWQAAPALPQQYHRPAQLTLSAFLAFIAYMSLLNVDLIWVNRLFTGETAALYATAVLLRRALALLPAAVIVVMYPRAVAQVSHGRLPDKLLLQTAVVVILPTLLLTAVYATLGNLIIRWTFGAAYVGAAPLLLGMGVAMLGFGLTAVWLNFYLATRPLPFVCLLASMAVAQILLFNQFHASVANFVAIFALSGWIVALGGLLLYLFWLRPLLKTTSSLPGAIPDPH